MKIILTESQFKRVILKESYDNFFNDYCVDCIKDALGRKYSDLVDIVVKALDGGLDIDDFGITEVLDILRSLGNFQMYDIFAIAPNIVKCVEVCKEGEPKYVKPTVDRYIEVDK